MRKAILAVAVLALVTTPVFAAVQNVKVGGNIKTTSVIRQNFDLNDTVANNKNQNVILSQVGLNVSFDLTDNVSGVLGLANERLWGTSVSDSATDGSEIDLDTANVTMREFLYSPLTVTIGRQPLVYGNALLIGDGDSTTTVSDVSDLTGGANFDAIKAVLGYDPLTIDLFAAKVSEGTTAQNDDDDVDLYGVNASFKVGDKAGSVVEAYTFIRNDNSVIAGAQEKSDKLYVPGLRVSTNPIEGLGLQLEGAYQTGSDANGGTEADDISAYGLQAMFTFALPVAEDMKMGLSGGYTYLSGDKNTADSKDKAFVPLYEDQFTGRIFDTLVPVAGQPAVSQSNIKIANLAFEMTPLQDVVAKLSWYNLSRVKKGTDNGKVGNEIDLDVTYAYTEDVKFGLSAGIFRPGKYWATANGSDYERSDDAAQILTSVNVAF